MNKLLQLVLFVGILITPSCALPQYEKVLVNGVEKYIPKDLLDEMPDFAPPKKDVQKPAEESATDALEEDLAESFSWLSKISLILSVLIGALGLLNPGFGRLGIGKWLGLVALCSIGIVYATSFMWWIIGASTWVFILYLAWKLYKVFREKIELEKVAEELAELDSVDSKEHLKKFKGE